MTPSCHHEKTELEKNPRINQQICKRKKKIEKYMFQIMVTESGKDGTRDEVHHSGLTFGPSMEYTSAGVNRYVTDHHQCLFISTITNTNTNTNTNSDGQNVLRAAMPLASYTTHPTMVFLSTTLPLPGFNQVLQRFSSVSTLTELNLWFSQSDW